MEKLRATRNDTLDFFKANRRIYGCIYTYSV